MKFATAPALLTVLLSVYSARANEGPPPAITPETLVGVWEAAPSWAQRVYRLDIARRGDSYLAFTYGSERLVFRLTSSTVDHGKLVLRFTSLRDRGRGCNDLTITGSGTAFGDFGTFESTLRMYDPPYGTDHPELSAVRLSFTKPPWTRDLTRWSKESEKLIPRTRTSR
jgi:hypothetical protein